MMERRSMGLNIFPSALLLGGMLLSMPAWAQTYSTQIRERAPSPSGPSFVSFLAPERIIPGSYLPIYVAVKAGESDLKEIGWSLYCCASRVWEGGAYYVRTGEEKELEGRFYLNTLPVFRHNNAFFASGLVLYLSVWAVDREGRSSERKYFDVTLDPWGPKVFPAPKDGRTYARELGIITGDIHYPAGDGSGGTP